jgi:YidC/Oxa1 family membrane protein insertase
MDLTRFFLYTSLAVVTYLMLLAWQADYPPVVDDGGNLQTQGGMQQPSDSPPSLNSSTSSDVPTDLPTSPADASQTKTNDIVQGVTNSGETITVETDTFKIDINLSGGDITYLALPLYLKQIDVTDDPFVLLDAQPDRNYVSQSGLIGRDGIDSDGRAAYRSSSNSYVMAESADSLIVDLQTQSNNGVRITKRYKFTRGSYLIDVSYLVDNQSSSDWQANAYGQIKRDSFDDPSSIGGLSRTYLGFVSTDDDDAYIEYEFDDIDDGASQTEMIGGWIGFSQHYFVSAWIPNTETTNRFTARKNNANQYFGEFTESAFTVATGESGERKLQYYAGPKDQYILEDVSPNLDLTIDYSFLWFLASPIYWLLTSIDSLVSNYGISIVLLTVCVKALFYKLSETQYRSMAGMRRVMPKMQQLKESYGDDKMKLQKATMDLYKKEKINPFGGCLPMLVQMPVFIALYWVLLESVELRHAPFMLWLTDLSVRDPFFILPLLMGGTMYLQTTLSPAPADPMQAKVMKIMPVMMTALFLFFPAGLVLYWLTNGILGILQQWYISQKIEAAYEAKK